MGKLVELWKLIYAEEYMEEAGVGGGKIHRGASGDFIVGAFWAVRLATAWRLAVF